MSTRGHISESDARKRLKMALDDYPKSEDDYYTRAKQVRAEQMVEEMTQIWHKLWL
jgi:hypothetical protein